jgi:hypothetical protein
VVPVRKRLFLFNGCFLGRRGIPSVVVRGAATADEGQHAASAGAEPTEKYRPPALVRIGPASELTPGPQAAASPTASSRREEEAWLRDLLAVCQHARDDLRTTDRSDVQLPITDLERLCEKVQRRLVRLAAQEDPSQTR